MSKVKGTLVLFRHGQTEYNKLHYMTGLHDIPLTETGEDQAREAGSRIQGYVFDKAYSSTLQRAFNTAALALDASGSNSHLKNPDGTWNIEQRGEIVEADSGDFTARNKLTDPEILNYPHKYDIALPNGESDKQMVERTKKFYEDEILPRLERGETVLVSSHSGIMIAFEIAIGVRPVPVEDIWSNRQGVPNATPVVFEYEDGKLVNHFQIAPAMPKPPAKGPTP
ncbi:MAG TPA: histidine phosphatase family protein [Patescibacteria group bacterium]|nr:histidine phosphatase family protein [Patescibacteria group bacterium]